MNRREGFRASAGKAPALAQVPFGSCISGLAFVRESGLEVTRIRVCGIIPFWEGVDDESKKKDPFPGQGRLTPEHESLLLW